MKNTIWMYEMFSGGRCLRKGEQAHMAKNKKTDHGPKSMRWSDVCVYFSMRRVAQLLLWLTLRDGGKLYTKSGSRSQICIKRTWNAYGLCSLGSMSVGHRNVRTKSCGSASFPWWLQKKWNRITGVVSDWRWNVDSLLDFQNKDEQFSLENKGQTITEKIQNGALSKESDVDGTLGWLAPDLHRVWYWCLQEENNNNKREVFWYSTAHAKCHQGVET